MVVFGEYVSGLTIDGREVRAAVFNEHAVRAAAGLTLVLGAVAFAYAYFDQDYVPLQVVTTVFFIDFLLRVTTGLRFSPTGLAGGWMTRRREPEWTSARPKRFAWTLGLAMSFAMMVITNSGVRGLLPRTVCLICLTLMWMESVLGLCLGCEVHGLLVRAGLARRDDAYEICAHGACTVVPRSEIGDRVSRAAGLRGACVGSDESRLPSASLGWDEVDRSAGAPRTSA